MKACLCANAHFTKGVLACFLELMAKFLAILLFFSSIDMTDTYLGGYSLAKVRKKVDFSISSLQKYSPERAGNDIFVNFESGIVNFESIGRMS